MQIKFSKINILKCHAILIAIYFIIYIYGEINIQSLNNSFLFFKVSTLLIWLWCYFSSVFIGVKFYHPYRMFLCSFFIFLLGRIFIDILGFGDFSKNFLFYEGRIIEASIQFRTLILLILFLLFIHMGIITALFKHSISNNQTLNKSNWKYNKNLEHYGKWIFYIFFLPACYYYYLFISFAIEYGYANNSYGSDVINTNILIKISDDMLKIGFFILLASKAPIKSIKWPTILYMFILFFTLLTGNRVYFFTNVLVVMTYFGYRNLLNQKVTLIIGIILIILAVIVGIYRTFNNFSFIDNYEYDNFFITFFRDQGISVHTISLTIDMIDKDLLSYDLRYIFMPLFVSIGLFNSEFVPDRFFLADSEVFLYDSSYFSTGGGYGSSIISEFYACAGIIGVICGAFIIGFLLIYFMKLMFKSNWGIFIMLFMLPMIYYTPRSYPLVPIITSIQPFILTSILIIFINLANKYSKINIK